jgi:hypothetical protein
MHQNELFEHWVLERSSVETQMDEILATEYRLRWMNAKLAECDFLL